MNLYLVRHAEAAPIGGAVTRDADRPLSAKGEHDAKLIGRFLSTVDTGVRLVCCSPLLRAVRTAEIIGSQYAEPPEIRKWEILEPGFSPREVLEEVSALKAETLILVAHQPDLGDCIATMIAESTMELALPPAGTACLLFAAASSREHSRLLWLLTPDMIAALHPEW